MIVSGRMYPAAGVYAGRQGGSTKGASAYFDAQRKSDGFYLSSETQSFGAAFQKIRAQMDDVRMDRVSELQQKIADGTYSVSAEDIAASMLAMRY